MASTVRDVAGSMDGWAEQSLLGEGYTWLRNGLKKHDAAFAQLDSFAEGVDRQDASIAAASLEVLKFLKVLVGNEKAKLFVMTMLEKAVKEMHLARQLIEWMAIAAKPSESARNIGFKQLQPNPQKLEALRKAGTTKHALPEFAQWLADAVIKKNAEHASYDRKGKSRASSGSFANLNLKSDAESDSDDAVAPAAHGSSSNEELPDSPSHDRKNSAKAKKKRDVKVVSGQTAEEMKTMMFEMMKNLMAEHSRPSSAKLNLEEELAAAMAQEAAASGLPKSEKDHVCQDAVDLEKLHVSVQPIVKDKQKRRRDHEDDKDTSKKSRRKPE